MAHVIIIGDFFDPVAPPLITDSLPRSLPQCGRGLGYVARITDYKSEDSVHKLLDPVEAEMAMISWGFLDSILVTCLWMQAPMWVWAR